MKTPASPYRIPAPRTPEKRNWAPAVMGIMIAACAMLGLASGQACTLQQAKTGGLVTADITDAVCKELDAKMQDEPDYVKYICSVVEAGDPIAHTFLVKAKKENAAKFAEQHCAPSPAKATP